MNRHDVEGARIFGELIAFEVTLSALLASHPDKSSLRSAFLSAQDSGFQMTEDTSFDSTGRGEIAQEAYKLVMDRFRTIVDRS